MAEIKDVIRLARPKQWIKNCFVLIPLFFGGELLNTDALMAGLVTFLSFSLTASSIYCFNDLVDVEADRRHPVKCKRPVASGAVSVRTAYSLMALTVVLSILVLWLPLEELGCLSDGLYNGISRRCEVCAIISFYWVLNICYCARLKQYAIVDVCVIAFGFVLRILAGGFATGVVLSKWIVLMTFLLTLFLSFAKRRDDVIRMNETGEAPRKNTIYYNLTFINQAITITASVTLVCYIMYTVSAEVVAKLNTDKLYLTSILVLVGLLRYIQIAVVEEKSGDPTKVILRDRFTQVVVFLWVLTFLFIIYVS